MGGSPDPIVSVRVLEYFYMNCMQCFYRDPLTTNRPSFQNLTRQLSQPEIELLGWSEEDKSVHPEAAQLGADLIFGEELYKDLQTIHGSYESTGLYDSVSVQ